MDIIHLGGYNKSSWPGSMVFTMRSFITSQEYQEMIMQGLGWLYTCMCTHNGHLSLIRTLQNIQCIRSPIISSGHFMESQTVYKPPLK